MAPTTIKADSLLEAAFDAQEPKPAPLPNPDWLEPAYDSW
jgi:hypothetical protein